MNDGDKAKGKAAKAKASGKKVSTKSSAKEKGGKASKVAKTGSKKESGSPSKSQAAKKSSGDKGSVQSAPKPVPNPKSGVKASRADAGTFAFTNPAIESAFKRAVKKYPNAFRRLTD
jgi:hypothetical protein